MALKDLIRPLRALKAPQGRYKAHKGLIRPLSKEKMPQQMQKMRRNPGLGIPLTWRQ